MQVRFLGFNFSTNSANLSLSHYINHMINQHETCHKLGEHNRYIFFNTSHSVNYYVGMLLTVKEQKTFCELTNASGNLVVKVNELDSNSNLMDFNFFVLHKTTGLGMYQYYHQSCSLNSFGYFNRQRFSEYRDGLVDTEISAIPTQELTSAKKKTIKQKHKGNLSWEIFVRKEKLKELIEEFQKIKAFEYCFLTLTANEPEFQPLTNYVRKERTKLSFNSKSPIEILADAIPNIINKRSITEGKVIGTDTDGIERILRITDNPDNFGEYGYDDIATKINSLDVTQFEKSWVVQELLIKCEEYKHIFEVKAK